MGADFAFDVNLYDAAKKPIGQVVKAAAAAASRLLPNNKVTNYLDMDSNLPDVLIITTTGGDGDPVQFAYGGATWMSSDATHCSMGGGI